MTTPATTFEDNKTKYNRWTLNERAQHWILAASFILLVLTGFALKYPESWWVFPFTGVSFLFELRGLLHRISGAVFILLGVYHAFYMFFSHRGRTLFVAMKPSGQDIKDLVQNVSYNFGRKTSPPRFRHFSYMEKAEYYALIWGGVIMGITGLMLWFEGLTLRFFPKWIIDLMTVIHLYEAWLATLAIVVWHFYYVIFNPDVYPLNTTMLDGKITDKQMRHEYFLEWQELQKKDSDQEPGHHEAALPSESSKQKN